ncbi:unnamed protein product [Meloidogyne enterolobii]|uniref:Uncharacterized protein n=1 Tax=Meloidogyne enterolobii TaxID=390850 RepID=A0ACB0Z2W9_MELEN
MGKRLGNIFLLTLPRICSIQNLTAMVMMLWLMLVLLKVSAMMWSTKTLETMCTMRKTGTFK